MKFLDHAHDETIEQRYVTCRSGSGLDATARKELKILEDGQELVLPRRRVFLLNSS